CPLHGTTPGPGVMRILVISGWPSGIARVLDRQRRRHHLIEACVRSKRAITDGAVLLELGSRKIKAIIGRNTLNLRNTWFRPLHHLLLEMPIGLVWRTATCRRF